MGNGSRQPTSRKAREVGHPQFLFSLVPDINCAQTGATRLKREIPYVDAFGVELASDSRDHVFVTADFDFKPASRDVTIEFLPAK